MAMGEVCCEKFDKICRVCLKRDDCMESIFETVDVDNGELSIAQRIATIARVQIHQLDGLPALICHTCRSQVDKSYNFQLLVEISDRSLRHYLDSGESEEVTVKEESSDKSLQSSDEENMDLENFLLENDITNHSDISVVFFQSEDGAPAIGICNIGESERLDLENERSTSSDGAREEEFANTAMTKHATCKLDDEEISGLERLLTSNKMYLERTPTKVQRIYTCDDCDEMFLSDDTLSEHCAMIHAAKSEDAETCDTEVRCQLCFDSFASLSELKNHVIEHFDGSSIKSEGAVKIVLDNDENEAASQLATENHSCCKLADLNGADCSTEVKSEPDDGPATDPCDGSLSTDEIEDVNGNNVVVRLNLNGNNDPEYGSDIFYCIRKHVTDRAKNKSKVRYCCENCDKVFAHKHDYTLHLRRHLGIKPFNCIFCDKAFITNASRKEHERTHTGEKLFVCMMCGKSFVRKSELKYHEGIHTNKPTTCTVCNKRFSNVQSYKMHMKRHIFGSRYVCEICGKRYYTNSELSRHVQMHSGKRAFPCDLCQTSFLSRPELNRHLKYHIGEKKFRCQVCFKTYFESGHLKIHQRIHTGEKPFACNICSKAFITKPKLIRHSKTHSKEQRIITDVDENQQKKNQLADDIA